MTKRKLLRVLGLVCLVWFGLVCLVCLVWFGLVWIGFGLHFCTTVHHLKTSRQELKAGTWRQGLMYRPWMSTVHWLALHGFLSLLPYTPKDHQSRGGPAHKQLEPPSSIMPPQCTQAGTTEVISQLRFSLL